MIKLIGTVMVAVGVIVILVNPMLFQVGVAAITLGGLSLWVTQN